MNVDARYERELEEEIRHNDGSELGLLKVIAYILLAILRKMK